MADPFVAEIRIFPFNFAPAGWAFCNGQILPISQNTALFSLLGTTYGGDGKSNFALPNIQGACVMHPGQGQGLSLYDLGQTGGEENVTLLGTEIPAHTHTLQGGLDPGNMYGPDSVEQVILTRSVGGTAYTTTTAPAATMAPQTLGPAGASLPHNNMQPYLVLNFCIALQGVFPARP
ncbi:MAG TPA: tail fiber protein [Thermoanaerobaculia bacterium]|nr:tail fiber protein [Thermoanaerobaculia bacterium]